LYSVATDLLNKAEVLKTTEERYKGKIVRRELRRVDVPDDIEFSGATQFVGVRQTTIEAGKEDKIENRVFITSSPKGELTASDLLKLVRLHWGIENNSNWTLDVIFDEDSRSPCYVGYGSIIYSFLLTLAYNLVSSFRSRLPLKDNRYQSFSRCMELIYQAMLIYVDGISNTATE